MKIEFLCFDGHFTLFSWKEKIKKLYCPVVSEQYSNDGHFMLFNPHWHHNILQEKSAVLMGLLGNIDVCRHYICDYTPDKN